jgi:predicted GTPase
MSQTIDYSIYENPTINIAILGCVSSGKSTLMNSLFAETYSDMKIRKTTMCPQVYTTNYDLIIPKISAKNIRNNNTRINNSILKTKNKDEVNEIEYEVPPMKDIIKLDKKVNFKIYDIPGLNDSETKDVLYDYVKNNFYKFDIVLFLVDINSGLNTTDELDILKLINSECLKIKKKYNKEIIPIIICNKCDMMKLGANNELLLDEDYEEMFEQVKNIVANNVTFMNRVPIIKYSAAYTYMYRLIEIQSNIIPENLDKSYLDKIGMDVCGRLGWTKITKGKTFEETWQVLKPYLTDIDYPLKLSGFEVLSALLTYYVSNNTKLLYHKINYIVDNSVFDFKYNYIRKIDSLLDSTYGDKIVCDELEKFINFSFSDLINLDKITDDTFWKVKNGITKLKEYRKLNIKDGIQKIDEYILKFDKKIAEYYFEKLSKIAPSSFESAKEIFEYIKIYKGINYLYSDGVISSIQNISMDFYGDVINYLETYSYDRNILMKIYMSKFTNWINSNPNISSITKNYFLRQYIITGKEIYNFISSALINVQLKIGLNLEKIQTPMICEIDPEHMKRIKQFHNFVENYFDK